MEGRKKLENTIKKILQTTCIKKNSIDELQKIFYNTREYPSGKSSEILLGIRSLNSLSVEELFWLSDVLNIFYKNSSASPKISIDDFFTNVEKTKFKNSKWIPEDSSIYPIIFDNLLQVNQDQWVGVVNTDTLLQLYNEQIINYNKNTQRNLVRKTVNGVTTYKINIKRKSVNEIRDLMSKHLFISNDISLNLNLDNDELDYEVYENKIVLKAGQLDIIDGYHRFRALIMEKQANPDFEYTMIVNFMNFSETKANSFIAQEDKRNKIDKQYSRSLDTNNPTFLVVDRLNDDVSSYLYGYIGTGLLIEKSFLFALIDSSFEIKERKEAMKVFKLLKNIFNNLIDDEIIELNNINPAVLSIIVRGSSKCNLDEIKSIELIKKGLNQITSLDQHRCELKRVNKPFLNMLDDFIEKVERS